MRIDIEKAYNFLDIETNLSENPDWKFFRKKFKIGQERSNQMSLF